MSAPYNIAAMPFPDELARGLSVHEYDPAWPADFADLKSRLGAALGDLAIAIDHIGSTSVPGLPAKDCIDVQIRVAAVDEKVFAPVFESLQFRLRPEPWNRLEDVPGAPEHKLVYAPPIGARTSNIHLRAADSNGARHNLLFRDYLTANEPARTAWGQFKKRLAGTATDLFDYGQIKQPATRILFIAAGEWAARTGWTPV
jgi:GrpB-like predicted nucleotidyltransferase (UPF0157 family)